MTAVQDHHRGPVVHTLHAQHSQTPWGLPSRLEELHYGSDLPNGSSCLSLHPEPISDYVPVLPLSPGLTTATTVVSLPPAVTTQNCPDSILKDLLQWVRYNHRPPAADAEGHEEELARWMVSAAKAHGGSSWDCPGAAMLPLVELDHSSAYQLRLALPELWLKGPFGVRFAQLVRLAERLDICKEELRGEAVSTDAVRQWLLRQVYAVKALGNDAGHPLGMTQARKTLLFSKGLLKGIETAVPVSRAHKRSVARQGSLPHGRQHGAARLARLKVTARSAQEKQPGQSVGINVAPRRHSAGGQACEGNPDEAVAHVRRLKIKQNICSDQQPSSNQSETHAAKKLNSRGKVLRSTRARSKEVDELAELTDEVNLERAVRESLQTERLRHRQHSLDSDVAPHVDAASLSAAASATAGTVPPLQGSRSGAAAERSSVRDMAVAAVAAAAATAAAATGAGMRDGDTENKAGGSGASVASTLPCMSFVDLTLESDAEGSGDEEMDKPRKKKRPKGNRLPRDGGSGACMRKHLCQKGTGLDKGMAGVKEPARSKP
jgi:hypothetical protein